MHLSNSEKLAKNHNGSFLLIPPPHPHSSNKKFTPPPPPPTYTVANSSLIGQNSLAREFKHYAAYYLEYPL